MSLINQKGNNPAVEKAAQDLGLTGDGMGESDDYLSQENHLFINKLNYICKNYDTSFKDVSIAIKSVSNDLACMLDFFNQRQLSFTIHSNNLMTNLDFAFY